MTDLSGISRVCFTGSSHRGWTIVRQLGREQVEVVYP